MRNNPRLLMLGTAAVVVIVGLVLFVPRLGSQLISKSYGRVGDYTVRKAEVDAMSKQNPKLSKDAIVTTLLNLHLYRQVAAKIGIHVTESDVSNEIKRRIGNSPLWDKLHLTA